MRKQGKIEKDQVWVQAALDMEDIELAKRVAFLALDNGAEWLEVGTPLLYRYGFSAIGIIRQAVGQNAVLVADYKCPIARLCASPGKRHRTHHSPICKPKGYCGNGKKSRSNWSKIPVCTSIRGKERFCETKESNRRPQNTEGKLFLPHRNYQR